MIIKIDELDLSTMRVDRDPVEGDIIVVDKIDPEWTCYIHLDSMDGICFQPDDDDIPIYFTVFDIEVAEEDKAALMSAVLNN